MFEIKKTGKKVIAVAAAAAIACTALAGCGVTQKTSDGKVSISICAWPNKDTNPTKYQLYEEKKERFNELYPDIEIVPDEWTFDIKTFLPKAEGKTLPTLYPTYFTEGKKIMDMGYAADITKQFKEYGYYDKMNEFVLQNISTKDSVYLIPRSIYTVGLIINLDLFREVGLMNADGTPKAPTTFEELAETAKIITEKTGKAGFVMPTTENGGGWLFTPIAWNFGAKFTDKTDGKWKATFDTDECAQALEYIKSLKWNYNTLPSNTLANQSEMRKLVATGQAAMCLGGLDTTDSMVKEYGMKLESIGLAKMPAGPKRHVTLMGGGYYAIRNDATEEQKDAVFKWLEFDGIGANLTDDLKANIEKNQKMRAEEGKLVGVKDFSYWNENSEIQQYKEEMIDKYSNIKPEQVALYNDKTDVEYQFEEPVCAQDLYSLLDSCLQQVLTDKNADCRAIVNEAAQKFQTNYLDYEN